MALLSEALVLPASNIFYLLEQGVWATPKNYYHWLNHNFIQFHVANFIDFLPFNIILPVALSKL